MPALYFYFLAQVLPRIKDTPEFAALADEDARKTAFDKFIRRQKVRSHLH